MNTRAEVEKALVGTDTSDLRASFRRALSFSIPPLTLYHNYRPGAYSDLIFGVPLVNPGTNHHNVPKVMRMCIEEVEKRGLNTYEIYLVSLSRHELGFMQYSCLVSQRGSVYDAEVLEASRIHPTEQPTNINLHSVTAQVRK